MKVPAPAKLNLFLQVRGRRPDGYHDIVSLMAPVSLADEVSVEPLRQPVVEVEGGPPGLPVEANLAWKAARLLAPFARTLPGARIVLDKRIPVGGGLGGGSSDAAAVLTALNALWDCRLALSDLLPLAKRLGADVPFFLYQSSAVVRGVGDRVTPVVLPPGFPEHLAVLKPPFELSTSEVYQKWDTLRRDQEEEDPRLDAFLKGDRSLPLRNDLEAAAFALRPELGEIKKSIMKSGACMVLMSGSGSCLWAAWCSPEARGKAVGALTKRMKIYIVSPVPGNSGHMLQTASQED